MTPYEIRLELLKMAKDIISEDFYARREEASMNWQTAQPDNRANGGGTLLVLPNYPSEDEIIKKATALNNFVSADTKNK